MMLGIVPLMPRPAIGKSGSKSWSLPWPRPGQIAIAFFLLFFLYVWFRIEPAVAYQHSSPVFLLTRSFLGPFLEYPGGLLDYTAAGLSQLNYYNWLGALVFTALGGLLWLGTQKVLARIAGTDSRAPSFGIAFLLLLLREQYDRPVLAMSTGLLAAVGMALGYFRLFRNPGITRREPKPRRRHPDPQRLGETADDPSPALKGTLSKGERDGERGLTSIPRSAPIQASGSGDLRPKEVAAESSPDLRSAGREPPHILTRATSVDPKLDPSPRPSPLPEGRGGIVGSSQANQGSWAGAWLLLCVGWIVSSLLFYIAGAWPCALFLVLIGLFVSLHGRRQWLGLACALPVPMSAWWLISFRDLDQVRLLNPWCQGAEGWLLGGALYLFLPLACALSAWADAKPEAEARRVARKPTPRSHWYAAQATRRALGGGLFVLGWGLVWFGLAAPHKRIAEMDYYSSRGDYERVLAVARGLTREQMDVSSEARLHLALYHTGRLGQDVFSYRNQTGWDLLPGLRGGLESCRAQSKTLLELGLVGDAEHLAHEALENEGERPELLRILAQVNVLKDRPRAARVFLNVLGQIPFQRGWAKTWLRQLEGNPGLTGNPELDAIRPLMPTNDLAHQALPAEGLLVQLLRCNPTNQMAFEYLMAEYLMNGEVNKLADRLGQLDSFKYAGIPRHYEEAVLLYQKTSRTPVELHGRSIRPETIERFRRFTDAMNQRALDTDEGRQTMARDFGDTFWYYYFGRRSAAKSS
jgi:hypothetical protein